MINIGQQWKFLLSLKKKLFKSVYSVKTYAQSNLRRSIAHRHFEPPPPPPKLKFRKTLNTGPLWKIPLSYKEIIIKIGAIDQKLCVDKEEEFP